MGGERVSVGEGVCKELNIGGEVEELLGGYVDGDVREVGIEMVAGVGDKLEPVQLGGDEVDGIGCVESSGDVASNIVALEANAASVSEGEGLMEGAEGGEGETGSGRVDEGKGAREGKDGVGRRVLGSWGVEKEDVKG